jgi:hypothetical protein
MGNFMQKQNMQSFDRGSALSIFGSDRKEDVIALILALIISFFIYVAY